MNETTQAKDTNGIRVFVGLGSNSTDACLMLERAREGLADLPGVLIRAASPIYVTEPQGYADQPWFHNQVLELNLAGEESIENAKSLMAAMLNLEAALGRVRSPDPALRFGPRKIDLDILLFGKIASNDPFCTLPHPRLNLRAFWLVPLRDLDPDLEILGENVQTLLGRLDWHAESNKIYQ